VRDTPTRHRRGTPDHGLFALAHTGRDEDTALVTDDGIVKLFENACGAVDVSGLGGER